MASFLDQSFPDEEDEDDFNPQAEVASDDGSEPKPDINEDSADEDKPPASRSRSRSKRAESEVKNEDPDPDDSGMVGFGRDQEADEASEPDGESESEEPRNRRRFDDDELDAESEEESDDDIDGQPSRKRRKKHRRNQFIDVEAEVDEEEDEEPEEDDDMPGEEMHPDDLQELPPGADRDDRKHRELDRQREREFQMDVEETAARLKERYGRQQRTTAGTGAIVPQRLLMPGTEDPRIWRLKCRGKKEKEIISSIMERVATRANSRDPIQILTAFAREGVMEGNLYIEAWREQDIIAAVDGVSHVFMGTKPTLIPLEEMPDLLRIKKSKQLEPAMYVRIKRGLYQGDLAMVSDVDTNGTEVELKIVPRLDYGQNEDVNAPIETDASGKRKRLPGVMKKRPPPRLFSETEARKKHSKYLQRQGGMTANDWMYQNKTYIGGYLLETFRINALETENVNPTLEEVSKFGTETEGGVVTLDLQMLQATIAGVASDYLPGDYVELFKGEQKGVTGRAVEVYGDVVKMKVDSKGALRGQTIEAPIKDIRKLFREGDHVKVIGGNYVNEVGMVVEITREGITILTDSNQQEVQLLPKDLRVATDSGGNVTGSKYSLFELVQLDASTVACVIKVDRESLRIMDQDGSVRSILPSAVSNKIENRRQSAVATDRNGNEMKVDDTIKEFGGEQRQGRVLHLHRNFVFVQNRERAENAGVFVARHSNVVTVAAKGGRLSGQNGIDLTKMNPAMRQNGAPAGGPMPPPQQKGRDRLIGRTVKIRKGQQKGLMGIVKDASDATAKVELHGKNKQISINKDDLLVVDPHTGLALPENRQPPGMAGRTPAPGNFGRTPFGGAGMGGGRTPAYAMAGGGRTPAWKQDAGARTPAFGGGGTAYGGGFGGATAYGGGATAYGGQTSYGGGSVWGGNVSVRIADSPNPSDHAHQQSTWNANPSSRTPLHNPGNKTPAYSGGLEAPTPGFNSAPTPGNYGDQPTPGGFRETGQYRTPAAYQTPGGFPETPGAGYDEDGPKYD